MSGDKLQNQVDEVRALMETHLRIRGKTLARQMRKAGRLLPRHLRRDAAYLAGAETVMRHPKLARMVDPAKAVHAHARLVKFLKTVDPKDRARCRFLAWLGSMAFAFIVAVTVIVTVLVQRGIV